MTKENCLKEKYVVVINGPGTHGKDTFIKACEKYLSKIYPHVPLMNHSTVDTVKRVCMHNFGASPHDKSDANRVLWSDIKDAWDKYNDGTHQETMKRVRMASNQFERMLFFVHCREPEKIKRILNECPSDVNGMSLLIYRPEKEEPRCAKDSMANIRQGMEYDWLIVNKETSSEKIDATLADEAQLFCDSLFFVKKTTHTAKDAGSVRQLTCGKVENIGYVVKPWGTETIFENNALYCGKTIVIRPGETSSEGKFHYHKEKTETFHVLAGRLLLDIYDRAINRVRTERLQPGDSYRILTGVSHRFRGEEPSGCRFLEVSTTHKDNDSYYEEIDA